MKVLKRIGTTGGAALALTALVFGASLARPGAAAGQTPVDEQRFARIPRQFRI